MTVGELIALLAKLPADAPVAVRGGWIGVTLPTDGRVEITTEDKR